MDDNTQKSDKDDNNSTVHSTGTNNVISSHSASFDLEGLSAYMKSELTERTGRSIPPLDKWYPQHNGQMDLLIKANGEWWHEGTKITRESLVQLFSTVLWCEDDGASCRYFLKTPIEKILIEVEDVPFLINDVNVVVKEDTPWLEFVTKTGDVIYLDDAHRIIMREYQGEMRPYILVRFGMYGLIARSVFMHLVQLGTLSEHTGKTLLTLQSGGKDYHISVIDE